MKCQFCNESNVRQSFAEIGESFHVQTTCPDCGAGCGSSVTREEGLEMIAAQEAAEREAAELAKEEGE